jgi:hypothetical protein
MTDSLTAREATAWRAERDAAELARGPKPNGSHDPPPPADPEDYGAIDGSTPPIEDTGGVVHDSSAALAAPIAPPTPRRRKSRRVENPNDPRPTIRLAANDIERIVDEAEAALIKADRGIYQRDGSIVFR